MPLMMCASLTAGRLGAAHMTVMGAAHHPHVDRADVVNSALEDLFAAAYAA
ncbi:hypothetical protein [Actinocorallia longicatena]|uniref:hypothetical protein n=1 Tax=Actinocorallia longicatena TaxID=111803 RepID=UPI003CD0B0D8